VRSVRLLFALALLALAACDTVARHDLGADGCGCYTDIYRPTPSIIGHSWKM
jgi:hypothetical protein